MQANPATGKLFGRTLLVEDEPAHALLIERALRPIVESVRRCISIAEGVTLLKSERFELIISDLNLPDLQSSEAVRELRAVAPKLPLLVLTSSSTLSDGVSAMRAGASDFLVKSFDSSFADGLHLVLSRLRSTRDADVEREQVLRDRDLLRAALDESNDGLAVVERDGRVRYCNSSFKGFLNNLEPLAEGILDIPPDSLARGGEVLTRLRENLSELTPGGVWTTEIVKEGDDERAFELSVSACRESLIEGEADSARRLVLWVRDIGEKRRRDRFQREIISTTTHDLKGSLGAIAVSCDVLLESSSLVAKSGEGEGAQKRMHALLERVASSANSAINLVEEFLSMRRIEEGALVMHPVINPLSAIISKVVDSLSLTAKTRGIAIDFISVRGEEILGCVDPLSFERVVANLVSNAIKFSAGVKRVEVSLKRQDGGVVLRVRDFGVGMEPGDAKRLFNRYARLAAHKGVAGSGLGLFIVKCIVSAHGGSIDVTSAIGQGTTFEIFFPDSPPCNEQGELVCVDLA